LVKSTSNVSVGLQNSLEIVGTMAHEWLQAGQALSPNILESQKFMLTKWIQEYQGDLGIALADTIGISAFIKEIDPLLMRIYDGLRHDSGSPYKFTYKVLKWYKCHGIDPKSKTIIYSDGLTFDDAVGLWSTFNDEINVKFGIGTNLTNNLIDVKPMQIVMKMVECNGQPVAKLSDSPGKNIGNDRYVENLKEVYKWSPLEKSYSILH